MSFTKYLSFAPHLNKDFKKDGARINFFFVAKMNNETETGLASAVPLIKT